MANETLPLNEIAKALIANLPQSFTNNINSMFSLGKYIGYAILVYFIVLIIKNIVVIFTTKSFRDMAKSLKEISSKLNGKIEEKKDKLNW